MGGGVGGLFVSLGQKSRTVKRNAKRHTLYATFLELGFYHLPEMDTFSSWVTIATTYTRRP